MYWPKDVGSDAKTSYGYFEIQLEREQTLANYTIRTMRIKNIKVSPNSQIN